MVWDCIWWYCINFAILKHFLWVRLGVHDRAENKHKMCVDNFCFKRQLQADSLSQGDKWILMNKVSYGITSVLLTSI